MPQPCPDPRPLKLHSSPLLAASTTSRVRESFMFQDAPFQDAPSRRGREILLMSLVLTLANLALSISRASRVYLFEQAQCLLYYQSNDPTQISSQHGVDESLCKLDDVQYPLSIVVGIDSCLALLPGLLILAIYRQLLPSMGLRYLVNLNLSCSALGVLFSTIVFWTHRPWSIYAAPLSFVFDLIGGGEVVRITIISTCIAELSPSDELTKIYNYISGTYNLAIVGGTALGTLLLSNHVWILNALSIVCYAVTMLVAVCIPSHCGRETKVAEDVVPFLLPLDEPELPSSSIKLPDPSRSTHSQPTLFRILLDTWYASYHSLLTLVKAPNPTLTVILVFLVYSLAFNIQVLLPQYTSLVLDWPFATVNGVLALKALVSSFLLFALPSFRIFFLEPTMSTAQIDLLISQGSLLASVVGMVGLGFSKSTGTFITSLCIFTASVGFGDSLCSYGTYSLPKGESLGNYYVRLGLIQTIAGLVGAPLLSGIFSLVLKSEVLPIGLPFWLCAAVFGLGVLGTGALKRWHEIGVRGGASMD